MSTDHGPITLKPIDEIAGYLKNLLPAQIPESYALKSRFETVAEENNIRIGAAAFRNFLSVFCDRLISDGDAFVQLPKKPKSVTDYPFIYQITDLLADIGYHGKLSENGEAILITELPSFTAWTDANGKRKSPKNPASKLAGCLHFLTLCGFVFTGVDPEKKAAQASDLQLSEVSYPDAPLLPTGLKALSIADIELRTKRYVSDYQHDNLLRCDYRLLQADETDPGDVLRDFLHPFPEKIRQFGMDLHQRYTELGMICATILSPFDVHFAYAKKKNSRKTLTAKDLYQQRVWEFAFSVRHGYCLAVRAKKTDGYTDVIQGFSPFLQEKITRGYGCDRKRGEPCQGGCQGIRLPLDESLVANGGDVQTWLDHEIN